MSFLNLTIVGCGLAGAVTDGRDAHGRIRPSGVMVMYATLAIQADVTSAE